MRIMRSARYLPWFAGIVGIAGGVMVKRAGNPAARGDAAAEAGEIRGDNRAGGDKSREPGMDGRTFRFLGEMATAPEARCEDFVRACKAGELSGQGLELEIVFRRWLTLKSAGEVRKIVEAMDGRWTSDWQTPFFNAWVVIDEKAAMATSEGPFARGKALHAVKTARDDFAGHLKGQDSDAPKESLLGPALNELGRDRPDLVRSLADAELASDLKHGAIAAAVQGWASKDPAAAMTWLESIGKETAGTDAFGMVVAEWLKQDPEAAAKAWGSSGLEGISLGSNNLVNQVLQAFKRPETAAPQAALAVFRDPSADIATIHRELLEAGIGMPGYAGVVMSWDGWYPADLPAAAREAEGLPPGPVRDYLLQLVCNTMAESRLEEAAALAERNGIKSSYIERLLSTPDAEMRSAVFADPETSFSALLDPQQVEPHSKKAEQLHAFAREWSEQEPEAASQWLMGLSLPHDLWERDPQMHALFGNTLGYHWARRDPVGAAEWAAALPDAALRVRAWQAMAERVAETRPDLAFTMSAGLLEGKDREHVLGPALAAAQKTLGEEAARELLNAAPLSEQERAALSESLRSAR
jgi:hypothetical protein